MGSYAAESFYSDESDEVSFGDYLLVVAIRGMDSDNLNLTATGHSELTTEAKGADFSYGEHVDPESRVGFYEKNTFKTIRFRISQNLDVYSHELQQKDLAMFTAAHPMNQIVTLFGQHFMALDWDDESGRLFGFEAFKDMATPVDIVTALEDNSQVYFYSRGEQKLWHLERRKKQGMSDKVYESHTGGSLMQGKHESLRELLNSRNGVEDDSYADRGTIERHFLKIVKTRFDQVESMIDSLLGAMDPWEASIFANEGPDFSGFTTASRDDSLLLTKDPILRKYAAENTQLGRILRDLGTLASGDQATFRRYVRALEAGEVFPPEI